MTKEKVLEILGEQGILYYGHKFIDELLRQPFEAQDLDYRVKSKSEKGDCTFLTYVDTRAVQKRLDIIFPNSWDVTVDSIESTEDRICVTATLEVKQGLLSRSLANVGEKHLSFKVDAKEARDRDNNSATSAYAQAFKRAASLLGIGEYIYDLSNEKDIWVKCDYNKPVIDAAAIKKFPGWMFPRNVKERLLRLGKVYCALHLQDVDLENAEDVVGAIKKEFGFPKELQDNEFHRAEAAIAHSLDNYIVSTLSNENNT